MGEEEKDITQDSMVTLNKDGTIKEQYTNDNNTSDYATSPKTTTVAKDSKTGSGIDAALGTEYSWDTKASERANLDYEKAVLESKSNYLTNRQELESQGQQLQQQVDMQKYSTNQSNEKAGWTGGYVLDTERQMAYLKQTIQSQMYGQMELQKYGYDTSLAAARLAYDTNKYDLALEYYNTALQRAVTEADITGYYVAPEVTEMLNEYSIASSILNAESGYSDEERERADKVIASVYEWFQANGISKEGVMTMSKYESERDWNQSLLDSFEYIDETTHQITGDKFIEYGADGKPVYSDDGTSLKTKNFKTMTTQEIIDYISINNICKEQFYGYLDNKITGEMSLKFEDWCIAQGQMTKNDDGTYSAKDGVKYNELIYNYLKSSQAYQALADKLGVSEEGMESAFQTLLENYDFQIDLPDGSTINNTFAELDKQIQDAKNAVTSGTLNDLTKTDANGDYTVNFNPQKQTVYLDGNATETVYIKESNLIFTSLVGNEGTGMFNSWGGRHGAETDVKLSNGIGDKYNLELAESANASSINQQDTDRILEVYERTYGKTMSGGTIIVYNDAVYVFCSGGETVYDNDETNNGDNRFAKLKGQCKSKGDTNFVNDLKGAMNI
jgi:hypothetical protein